MNRCNRMGTRLASAMCVAVAGLLFTLTPPAQAQGIQRTAPKDVVPAKMVVTAPPEITLDGKPDRLSPGSRIRDLNNMLALSGSLVGTTLPVVYRRDAAGLVHEVWILTADEYSRLTGATGAQRLDELLAFIFGARR